jgi:Ni/Co efflux regulator RcnB
MFAKPIAAILSLSLLAGAAGAAFAQPANDPHRPGRPPVQEQHGQENRGQENHGQENHGQPNRYAEYHHADRDNEHPNWRQGQRMDRGDWNRGQRVDYRENHLRQPPRGYEWREVDGRLILAAVATGLIADILLSAH